MELNKLRVEHDSMVRKIVEQCIKTGYMDVRANLPDTNKPERIGSFIPDVTGKKFCWVFIFEIETEESIDCELTEIRWKKFANYAKEEIQKFYIVIPRGMYKRVEIKMKEIKISAEIIEL